MQSPVTLMRPSTPLLPATVTVRFAPPSNVRITALTGDSKFSRADGHDLRNPLDIDGDPLDLDLLGYDESWIAAE